MNQDYLRSGIIFGSAITIFNLANTTKKHDILLSFMKGLWYGITWPVAGVVFVMDSLNGKIEEHIYPS
jgi:hypothetical protein